MNIIKHVKKQRINEHISADTVRVIDEKGENLGILPTVEAIAKAKAVELDLVEVSPLASPPVCRFENYVKLRYLKVKQQKQQKQKAPKREKRPEIKFRPVTDVGDFNIKCKKISAFLERGDRVKVTVRFRGREITHESLGFNLCERVKLELVDLAEVEFGPNLEGRQITMILIPKKKKTVVKIEDE